MQPTSVKSLDDVVKSCNLILKHTADRTLDDYRADPWLQAGVERHFEIIGEALRRIERTEPELASRITDYRDIIDFRNLLAHGYDLVNHARVWQVIQESLPLLKVEVEQLLSEAGSQS